MKKLAMLLAVLMLAVAAFSVSAFEDVTVDDACFDAVNTLTSLEVIKGKTETTFAPNDPVTREQMAMLFTRLYTTVNFENGENMTPFTDLDDPYFNSAIAWCYDAKVINGTTLTTFEPKAHIIYQDALTMACRLLGYTDLTYPLGNITKARLIGLTDGLEGVAYDKELTRGEVAIILYNALEAEGAEIIKENKVKYYNGYPILEAVERNFEIAVDVYNFKKETYQIVGTDNFKLAGYDYASTETSYNLILIDTDTDEPAAGATEIEMEFEDIAVAEDTNSDEGILAYLEILYRGDSLNDKKAIVLSSVINSDLECDAEIGVYFKKEDDEMVAKADKILVNGKAYGLAKDEMVYTVDTNGVISLVTDLEDVPVFWQTEEDEQGMYEQKIIDTNKDNVPDYILIFPMTFEKVTGVSSKGVYTLETSGKFDTEDEDCTLVINAEEVAKNDYVLTYRYGVFTVIDSVVEPVVTTVTKRTGSNNNYKFTLATGDVVTFAGENNPVLGEYKDWTDLKLDPSTKEIALYVINDKVVYTTDASTAGYEAYTYAFFVNKGDTETAVDTEDGTISKVNTLIAFMDGKAATIPVEETAEELNLTTPGMITIIDIEDGKYIVKAGVHAADQITEENADGFELYYASATIWYDTNSKIYKLSTNDGTYIIDFTADTELYAQNKKSGEYDSVKRYTMANFPQLEKTTVEDVIVSVVRDADDKIVGYNLLVAHIADASNMGDSEEYTDYRIVLTKGVMVNDKNEEYGVYEVLNPVTGAVETIVDEENDTNFAAGTLVREQTNGRVASVSATNDVFEANDVHDGNYTKKLMQINSIIANDTLATVFKGTNKGVMTDTDYSQELKVSGIKIVVLDYDNKTEELVIDVTEDLEELEGKVVRTYTTNGLTYKPAYMVVVPYEWAEAAGFTDLSAYDEYEEVDA